MKKRGESKNIDENLSWKVPEYTTHERSKSWYVWAIIAGVVFLIYSIFTANFLFALIIIIAGVVIIMNDGKKPRKVKIDFNDDGVQVGKNFYDYDEFRNFSIVYKPKMETKNVYFEYKNVFKQRLSLPLRKMNPIIIRKFLLQYLDEDLDRTDRPLSESLAKIFKI